MQQRLQWIDLAKGVGIIFVVIGHACRGLDTAGLPDAAGLLGLMDRAIYAFHMPLFFLLSGITFGMRPPANLPIKRLSRMFYAMLVWTYAFLGMQALAGHNSNASIAWGDVFVSPLPAVAHFWFLWALMVITAVLSVLWLVLRPVLPAVWVWCVIAVVTWAAHFTLFLPQPFMPYLGPALNYGLAFATGGLIGATPLVRLVPSWPVAVLGAAVFAEGVWGCMTVDLVGYRVVAGVALSLLLMLPLMSLSKHYATAGWTQFLAFLGVISLPIYVMHTLFSACMRVVLLKVGIDDLMVHLVLGIATGVLGPLCAYLCARRFGMLKIAGFA